MKSLFISYIKNLQAWGQQQCQLQHQEQCQQKCQLQRQQKGLLHAQRQQQGQVRPAAVVAFPAKPEFLSPCYLYGVGHYNGYCNYVITIQPVKH